MLVYAATIFLSAFLLFQVQPLIAKFILPWFGGSAAVWSAALLFFQLLLLAGYLYAHCLVRYLKAKQQLWLHLALLAASLATLPIIPSAVWKPSGGDDPTLRILLLLGATIGLPYTLLSATSPLLQAWYLRTHSGAIPYRLFALSNFGSMLALLSYPTLVEPRLALGNQARIWSGAYVVFAGACALAGWKSRDGIDPIKAQASERAAPPTLTTTLLWIGLAACASTLLLAVTSHLTQNIAPIPLLWVVPLSLYLLSFILCFESGRIYNRYLFLPLLVFSLGLFAYGDYMYLNNIDVRRKLIPALCIALFVCCMVCHGELARRKPHPRYLTQFYLMVSVGGAIGGLFVALAAPHIFRSFLELPVAMVACAALVTCVLWNEAIADGSEKEMARQAKAPAPHLSTSTRQAVGQALPPAVDFFSRRRRMWMRAAMVIATLGLGVYLVRSELKKDRGYVLSARNFYGVLHVRDDPPAEDAPGIRVLVHGTINHGTQLLSSGSDWIPTSYFGVTSGISLAIHAKGDAGPLRIGILGLGAGVTATLARAGDTLHYYEINPLVVQIAKTQFGFWRACPAEKRLFMGDGRLVLEGMPSEQLDFLAMDAFTSDAVPVHLLTKEAYATYGRHLKPDGVLAVNVSNRYLDLEPVVAQTAAELGWTGVVVNDDATEEEYYSPSTWILMCRSPKIFDHANFRGAPVERLKVKPGFHPWTDDYSNIIQILK